MTGEGDFIEVQGTAEGDPFSRAQLDGLLDLAAKGIRSLGEAQRGGGRWSRVRARNRAAAGGP